jgi:hypothetical protein
MAPPAPEGLRDNIPSFMLNLYYTPTIRSRSLIINQKLQMSVQSNKRQRTSVGTFIVGLGQDGTVSHALNGVPIRQREDGYLDATAMCKAGDKRFNDWMQNKSTKDYLCTFEAVTRTLVTALVQSNRGGVGRGNTWIHPKIAVGLAMWISPEFAVEVSEWVYRFATGDISLINDIVHRHDYIFDSKTQVTLSTVVRQLDRELQRLKEKVKLVQSDSMRVSGIIKDATELKEGKLTIFDVKELQPVTFNLTHNICSTITRTFRLNPGSSCTGQDLRNRKVKESVEKIFNISGFTITNALAANHITLYTQVCKTIKKRLKKGTLYSTEMPISHAFIYARNFNKWGKEHCYKKLSVEDDILEMFPNVERFSLKSVCGIVAKPDDSQLLISDFMLQ